MSHGTHPTDARSVSELLLARERAKFLLFWGHRPPVSGGVSASCFSQWWSAEFTVDGVTYATAEHYMMAGKARLFGDDAAAELIVAAGHPRDAKVLGRQVRDFDQEVWEAARFEIVVRANVAKFGQDPRLRDFLLGTGRRVLVEASPRDRVWGIGMSARDENAERPGAWRGPTCSASPSWRPATASPPAERGRTRRRISASTGFPGSPTWNT